VVAGASQNTAARMIYCAAMSESRRNPSTVLVILAGLLSLFVAFRMHALFSFGPAPGTSPFDPKLYSALQWRLIGPFRGGRSIAAAGVPSEPDTYYFGGVAGGVWKTTNSGRTWQSIFDHETVSSIGAIAVAPSDPNVIYVGTGESDIRSDISYGDGVYKSADSGHTWRHIGLQDSRAISRIVVDPHDARVVLVAALGHPYGPNAERGIFRSTDGGGTWKKVLYKDENTGAADIAADPETGEMVYASLWQARRPPWSVYGPIEGAGSGLYRSADGGVTWKELRGNGLPEHGVRRIGISVASGDQGRRVYALIDAVQAPERGLYRSDDAGSTWRHVSADARIDGRAWYFSGVFADPQNADTVYVANTALYRSTDGGATFVPIKAAPGGDDYHLLWMNPGNSKRMVLASDQGTVVSVDGGETWSSWYNQPTAQFYHVVTDNQFPYHVYGAQQDSGSIEIASRSDSPEISSRDWQATAGGEGGYMAPDPLHPDVVIGGDTYGSIGRLWKSTRQEQDIAPSLGRSSSFGSGGGCHPGESFRFDWTSPIVFSPKDPQALYFSSQVIWKTLDDGTSWQPISQDLTRPAHGPQPPSGGGPSDFQKVTGCGVVYTVAPSPLDADEIWAGTDDGLIQLTRDGGKTWKNVTPSSLGPWSKVSLMDAGHFDAGTAYAAVDRHELDDVRPHVLRTHDYGATWQEISNGLPAAGYVHVVREDSQRAGLLYAGTETGVSVSFDDGAQWQSLQSNLPTLPVHDLVVHGDDLVVATHGRSFWILDDVTPLRQLTQEMADAEAYLFKPQTAVRLRPRPFEGTPLPPDEPTGQNPSIGAVIDYELKSEPAGDVRLEILDAKGRPVRQYSTADKPAPPQRAPVVTSNWLPKPLMLTKNAGMNRFVWDLRYGLAPVATLGGGQEFLMPRGLMVLPGDYQVRLTVNGHRYTQPLKVELDPRVKTPLADLERQFTFEQQVMGAMSNARNLSTAIHDLQNKLDSVDKSLGTKPDDAALASQVKALKARLSPFFGESAGEAHGEAGNETGGAGRGRPAATSTPNVSRVLTLLTQAFSAADSADAAPTDAYLAAAHQAQEMLATARDRWDGIKRQDVKALNEALTKKGREEVDVMDDL
jgi:photosystem II stability/assembly factor-like uncharacterized protein